MQVPTGQIQTGPAFAKAIGATQRPGIAETLDWAAALTGLNITSLDGDVAKIQASLICLLKTEADLKSITPEVTGRLAGQAA